MSFSLTHEAQIVQEIVEEQFEPKDNDMPDLVEIKPAPKKKKFAAKVGKNIFTKIYDIRILLQVGEYIQGNMYKNRVNNYGNIF